MMLLKRNAYLLNHLCFPYFSSILFIACLFLIAGGSPASARVLVLNDNQESYSLMDYLEFLEDPKGALTIDEAASEHNRRRFAPRSGRKSNFGFSNSVFWARLRIDNQSAHKEWVAVVNRSYVATVDHINTYIPQTDGGFRCYKDGESVPVSRRQIPDIGNPAFKLEFTPGQAQTIYFRIHDEGLLYLPIGLYSWRGLISYGMKNFIWAVLLGAFVFFFLYNLLLYSSLRDPVFLYFSLVLISLPLAVLMAELNRFLPDLTVWWSNRIKEQIQIFNCITLLLLTRSYYKIDSQKVALNRYIRGMIFGCMLVGAAVFLLPYHWVLKVLALFNITVSLSVFFISVYFRYKGFTAGRYFLVAAGHTCWLAYLFHINSLGLHTTPLFKASMVMLTHQLVSLLLISLALIDRHNILAKQMLAAQQSAVESMRQAEQAKDEFLANTSHELRTPLHGIIGLTEDLLERCKTKIADGCRNELNIVIHSAKRLSALIDDILDVTRIKQGRLHLEVKPVDFISIFSLVEALCIPLIKSETLRLQTDVPEKLPLVLADEDRLQQILINLIKNAITFTSKGFIRITATVEGKFLVVAVKDSGIGIPVEKQADIFDRFTQVDGTTDRTAGGTGLGLAITRQLVELQGGSISVESTPGEGACFSFTLPLAAEEAQSSIKTGEVELFSGVDKVLAPEFLPQPFPVRTETENSANILIVDDEQISLHVLYNHLTTGGYNVTFAHDAFEAESLLKMQPFDLIVLDIMMPRLNGYAFCRNIRRDFNPTELPVIMLTARSQPEDLIQGFDCGANDYLTKPVNRLELLARIQTCLKLKYLTDLLRENKGLKEDIVRRKRAEYQLHAANRQLAGLLDLWEATLMMIDERCQILYFNQCAEKLFKYQLHEIINQPLDIIFRSQIDLIRKNTYRLDQKTFLEEKIPSRRHRITAHNAKDESIVLEVIITPMIVHGKIVYALICHQVATDKTQPSQSEMETIQALTLHHQKIQAMQGAFESVLSHLHREEIQLTDELQQIDQSMSERFHRMPPKELDAHFRTVVVDVMIQSLECWNESTGEDKLSLAEKSGIWRTYLDGNTYKTRTLDKYLDQEKLPKNPRWKDVLKTADFVLHNSRSDLLAHKTLAAYLAQLKGILRVQKKM